MYDYIIFLRIDPKVDYYKMKSEWIFFVYEEKFIYFAGSDNQCLHNRRSESKLNNIFCFRMES